MEKMIIYATVGLELSEPYIRSLFWNNLPCEYLRHWHGLLELFVSKGYNLGLYHKSDWPKYQSIDRVLSDKTVQRLSVSLIVTRLEAYVDVRGVDDTVNMNYAYPHNHFYCFDCRGGDTQKFESVADFYNHVAEHCDVPYYEPWDSSTFEAPFN